MANERVEAAAKAMWDATRPGIAWDELREASREPIRVQARAALTAADAVGGERVQEDILWFNNGPDKFLAATCGTWLQPGEELVVRKRRGG